MSTGEFFVFDNYHVKEMANSIPFLLISTQELNHDHIDCIDTCSLYFNCF